MLAFVDKLTHNINQNNSLLCVGLDPNPQKYPQHFPGIDRDITQALLQWGLAIIEQTADLVCCYKPNFAFYEQYGPFGLEALRQTIAAIPKSIPVLLDAKRGDIGHTASAYAKAAFETWGVDGITLNPYLGEDAIKPFLFYPGKMVFILCYTSNPSADTMQLYGEPPLFEHVVQQAQTWGDSNQVAFVVGATQLKALKRVRQLAPTHWFLAPGVGAQQADLQQALSSGLTEQGLGLIMPVSRSIIFVDDPRAAALKIRNHINTMRPQMVKKTAISDIPTHHIELIEHLYEVGCVQLGEFTLASGKQSPIYIDLRRVTASPRLLQLVAQAYNDMLTSLTFDHIAGVPYAALPIGTAVAMLMEKPLIYPRKEAKNYGTGKTVEGRFTAGDTAVVIEDLITSGGSVLKTVAQLEAVNLTINDIAVLIDRQQKGAETLQAKGYTLHSALKLTDILHTLYTQTHISIDDVTNVKNYLGIKD